MAASRLLRDGQHEKKAEVNEDQSEAGVHQTKVELNEGHLAHGLEKKRNNNLGRSGAQLEI